MDSNLIFKSYTYGALTLPEVADKLLDFYEKHKDYDTDITLMIGTDSQNFAYTKIVNVIAIICQGHGGIFFHHISHVDLLVDVRRKLHEETTESLDIAEKLVELLESDKKYEEKNLNTPIQLHIDAGNSDRGKTKTLIRELTGQVTACGYTACVKPDSYAASSIADRISK